MCDCVYCACVALCCWESSFYMGKIHSCSCFILTARYEYALALNNSYMYIYFSEPLRTLMIIVAMSKLPLLFCHH